MKAMILVLLLAGCATTKPGDTTTANLPIPVRCAAQPVPVPEWAIDSLPLSASPAQFFDALVIDRARCQAYEIELLAAVRACQ